MFLFKLLILVKNNYENEQIIKKMSTSVYLCMYVCTHMCMCVYSFSKYVYEICCMVHTNM